MSTGRTWTVTVLAVAALSAAGCSSGGGTEPGSAADAPPGAERSAEDGAADASDDASAATGQFLLDGNDNYEGATIEVNRVTLTVDGRALTGTTEVRYLGSPGELAGAEVCRLRHIEKGTISADPTSGEVFSGTISIVSTAERGTCSADPEHRGGGTLEIDVDIYREGDRLIGRIAGLGDQKVPRDQQQDWFVTTVSS